MFNLFGVVRLVSHDFSPRDASDSSSIATSVATLTLRRHKYFALKRHVTSPLPMAADVVESEEPPMTSDVVESEEPRVVGPADESPVDEETQ